METTRCDAIVLASMDYRESDRIVTLFTLQHGKVRGVARGARRSRRRFGPALEPFARIGIEVTIREGLSFLRGADIVTLHPRIRGDLLAIGLAGYAVELVDRYLPEGAPMPRLFRLLSAYLDHLDQGGTAPSDRRFFEANFLNIIGYRICLDRCASCGISLGVGAERRVGSGGVVLCVACAPHGSLLKPETAAILERCLETGRFGAVNFPPAALREGGALLDGAIAAHLSHPLKSITFLKRIESD